MRRRVSDHAYGIVLWIAALFQLVDGGQVLAIDLLRGVQDMHPHGDHGHWVLGRGRPDCLFSGILRPWRAAAFGLGLLRASALPPSGYCACRYVKTTMRRLLIR